MNDEIKSKIVRIRFMIAGNYDDDIRSLKEAVSTLTDLVEHLLDERERAMEDAVRLARVTAPVTIFQTPPAQPVPPKVFEKEAVK
jgi:hypothetical protein